MSLLTPDNHSALSSFTGSEQRVHLKIYDRKININLVWSCVTETIKLKIRIMFWNPNKIQSVQMKNSSLTH